MENSKLFFESFILPNANVVEWLFGEKKIIVEQNCVSIQLLRIFILFDWMWNAISNFEIWCALFVFFCFRNWLTVLSVQYHLSSKSVLNCCLPYKIANFYSMKLFQPVKSTSHFIRTHSMKCCGMCFYFSNWHIRNAGSNIW